MIGQTEYQVTARLGTDGEPSVKVAGICAYGDRTASVSVDITDEKVLASVGAAMKKAIRDVREQLNQEATAAAYKSLVVATDRGETLGSGGK